MLSPATSLPSRGTTYVIAPDSRVRPEFCVISDSISESALFVICFLLQLLIGSITRQISPATRSSILSIMRKVFRLRPAFFPVLFPEVLCAVFFIVIPLCLKNKNQITLYPESVILCLSHMKIIRRDIWTVHCGLMLLNFSNLIHLLNNSHMIQSFVR